MPRKKSKTEERIRLEVERRTKEALKVVTEMCEALQQPIPVRTPQERYRILHTLLGELLQERLFYVLEPDHDGEVVRYLDRTVTVLQEGLRLLNNLSA